MTAGSQSRPDGAQPDMAAWSRGAQRVVRQVADHLLQPIGVGGVHGVELHSVRYAQEGEVIRAAGAAASGAAVPPEKPVGSVAATIVRAPTPPARAIVSLNGVPTVTASSVPVAVNGKKMKAAELLAHLEEQAHVLDAGDLEAEHRQDDVGGIQDGERGVVEIGRAIDDDQVVGMAVLAPGGTMLPSG